MIIFINYRRLCILKGIFPKDPKKKFKGSNKTYYLAKDIRFLSHEKLLRKFREIVAYEKKIKKARMKNEKFDEKKLIENKPTYSIDHILKDRYPRFNDALSDMDDALCLISLFANLPKHELLKINSNITHTCQRLIKEFYLYCAAAQNFRKAFISIKGVYLTVEIMGQEVTWLTPFNSPQKLTFDIDYGIMLDFLELYTNLMKFVNLKLFKDIGLDYPPPLENLDYQFFGFNSQDIKNIQNSIAKDTNLGEDLNLDSEELKKIMQTDSEIRALKNLFKDIVFYIGREIPKELFGLAIASCGGLYGTDEENSPFQEVKLI
jgi:pescadillo protein